MDVSCTAKVFFQMGKDFPVDAENDAVCFSSVGTGKSEREEEEMQVLGTDGCILLIETKKQNSLRTQII